MAKFRLGDVQPNPFRHLDRYPYNEDKIETLRESIRATGFWRNMICRLNAEAKPEIAYGHHRLEAMRRELGEDAKIDLLIRDLDDEHMLKIMVRENDEDYGSAAAITTESVRAIVRAYADDKIRLGEITTTGRGATPTDSLRYAPHFVMGDESPTARGRAHPYTAEQVAQFAGWVRGDGRAKEKVKTALDALELIDLKIMAESDLDGLTSKQIDALVLETRRVHRNAQNEARRAEKIAQELEKTGRQDEADKAREEGGRQRAAGRKTAKKVAKEIGKELRSGGGLKEAPTIAKKITKPEKPVPDAAQFVARLASTVVTVSEGTLFKEIAEVAKFTQDLGQTDAGVEAARGLHWALVRLAEQASEAAAPFSALLPELTAPGDSDVIEGEIITELEV